MITREIDIEKIAEPQKVTVIYGPRRVGKTTLLKEYLNKSKKRYKLVTGDDIRVQEVFSSRDLSILKQFTEGYDILAIDEAQQIPNVGLGLKLLVDESPALTIIVTGSSSFQIAQHLGEPLTGRKKVSILYPLSQRELLQQNNPFELHENLHEALIFGNYPEVVTAKTREDKIEVLLELVNSYLLKDVFSLERIRGSKQLVDILRLLAFQIGNEVSLSELATQVHLDVKTVQRYLDILEKSFVIIRLSPFSRNLRKEISGKQKYYFYDTGIRNGLIAQFNALDSRNDTGALFENFMVIERLKRNAYDRKYCNTYFWRTYDQKEIDFIEEFDGQLNGYEFKWSDKALAKAPKDWTETYPNSTFTVVSRKSWQEFVL